MHLLCAQVSGSYSYLWELPFAEVQIVVWVSSHSAVSSDGTDTIGMRNTLLLSSASCLFAVSCLVSHLTLLKISSVTLPKAVLAWIVCIIIASHWKLRLFGLLFSGTSGFHFFFFFIYCFVACMNSNETDWFLNIGVVLWPGVFFGLVAGVGWREGVLFGFFDWLVFFFIVMGWISLSVSLKWNNVHVLW